MKKVKRIASIFLNLESAKKKKTCIRKLSVDNDSYITEPKEIMKEIHDLYEKIYDRDSYNLGENSIDRFLNEVDTKKFSDEEKMT